MTLRPTLDAPVTASVPGMGGASQWVTLLVICRLPAGLAAVALLLVHRVTSFDGTLVLGTIAWTALSLAALVRVPRLQASPLAWAVDALVALGLVWLSGDWRSPFYVFLLTTLVLPCTALPARRGLAWGAALTGAYLVVALFTRLDDRALDRATSVETVATHLLVPLVVTLALTYATEVLARLRTEQRRTERLAVQAERQRIAWELHDSAKQRVHAAHLVLTALEPHLRNGQREILDQALAELRSAAGDMDTSVAELRAPLDGRPVADLLRERARELGPATPATISVRGTLRELPPLVAAHAYRIAAEALTNAVRHAGARTIDVDLDQDGVVVRDDGAGVPGELRPGASGLRSMLNRAETIGAQLTIAPGPVGRGTQVTLLLPPDPPPRGDVP